MTRTATAAAILLLSVTLSAEAQEGDLFKNSKLLVAHWHCSSYAEIMDDEFEMDRHFNTGLTFGRKFFDQIEKGEITEADIIHSADPVALVFRVGPTTDFKLGRVHQYLRDETTKEIVDNTQSKQGYAELYQAMKTESRQLYQEKNCEFLD